MSAEDGSGDSNSADALLHKVTFAQVPLSKIWSRIEAGDKASSELMALLQGKHDLEEKNAVFALKASRMNVHENEVPKSSAEYTLGSLKNYFLFTSRELVSYHKEFGESVLRRAEEVRLMRVSELNKHKSYVQKSISDVAAAGEALDKAKKAHEKAQAELVAARSRLVQLEAAVVEYERDKEEKRREKEALAQSANGHASGGSKFSMSRMLNAFESTPDQERDRQVQRVHRRYNKVVEAASDITARKRALMERMELRDAIIQAATEVFQSSEASRLQSFKQSLGAFCDLEKKILDERRGFLDALQGAVHDLEPQGDVDLFARTEKKSELTHKYSKALTLLDWDVHRRQRNDAVAEEAAANANAVAAASAKDGPEDTEVAELSGKATQLTPLPPRAGTPLPPSGLNDAAGIAGTPAAPAAPILNRRIEQMRYVLSLLFPDPSSPSPTFDESSIRGLPTDIAAVSEELWTTLISSKEASDLFLQELDEKRGRFCGLGGAAFAAMASAMKVFLDYCNLREDVKSAMRIANMANTFYRADPGGGRSYLQKEEVLQMHRVWRGNGFWQAALMEGVAAQMDLMDPVAWDELTGEPLREAVINVHNIIFGQLGTIGVTMHELGLRQEEVEGSILAMCRGAQLAEDQEKELLRSIRVTFGQRRKGPKEISV